MPLVIGLTGGIGSGKTRVAEIFRELGAGVIDTDEIAHELTAAGQPGAQAVATRFGAAYLRADGALDRERMRNLVFTDPAAKKQLEAILHPMIRARVEGDVQDALGPYVIIVVPLLVETGAYRDVAQRILVVDSDEEKQVERVMRRSGLSAEQVRNIMSAQAARAERLRHAHDVVRNDADLAALRAQVMRLHARYLSLAASMRSHPGTPT
jgi:dephospho-CoA kinase